MTQASLPTRRAAQERISSPHPTTGPIYPEIQALRALAVFGVVIYHLIPGALQGGYTGVDVFFVISGFLITSHLMRELTRTGRIRLANFYARRARRLLPAALLALLVAAAITFLALPAQHWDRITKELSASAAYVENWALGSASVDYLSPTAGTMSPVQHFWSLSVEEQFYLVWPVLLLAGWFASSRLRNTPARRRVLVVVLSLVFAGSLLASIVQTNASPGPAYFGTHIRACEFASEGLLALLLLRGHTFPRWRAVLSWLGFGMIALTFLTYNESTPFPGYTALLPVVGTGLVIVAGNPDAAWSPRHLIEFRPVQYLGDLSYSLYLWHWPLLILALAILPPAGLVNRLGIVVVAVVLAGLSRRFVELPAQRWSFLTTRRPRFTLGLTAVAMTLILAVTGATSLGLGKAIQRDLTSSKHTLLSGAHCLGAASIADRGCADATSNSIIPGLLAAPKDTSVTDACWSHSQEVEPIVCSAGPTESPALRVALIGDSHANSYQNTLEVLAEKYRWRVDFIGKSACPWSTTTQDTKSATWNNDCQTWVKKLTDHVLASDYDLIITSYSSVGGWVAAPGETLEQTVADGFVDVWSPVVAKGIPIVALDDIPLPIPEFLDCIHTHPDSPGTSCARDQKEAFPATDAQPAAAKRVPGVTVLDYTHYFCQGGSCPPVIGGVIVYRNGDHLTGSYGATLAPMLRNDVLAASGLTERAGS